MTVTAAVGWVASFTVNVALSPSSTGTLVRLRTSPAASSSVMATTAESWVPSVTPGGSVPKDSRTDSPSSSTESSTASKAIVFSVSPELNTTWAGTL